MELDSMDDEAVLTEFRRWKDRRRGVEADDGLEEYAPVDPNGQTEDKRQRRRWRILDPDRPRLLGRGGGVLRQFGTSLLIIVAGLFGILAFIGTLKKMIGF